MLYIYLTSGRPDRVPSGFFVARGAPAPTPAHLETEGSGVNPAAFPKTSAAAAAAGIADGRNKGTGT